MEVELIDEVMRRVSNNRNNEAKNTGGHITHLVRMDEGTELLVAGMAVGRHAPPAQDVVLARPLDIGVFPHIVVAATAAATATTAIHRLGGGGGGDRRAVRRW